MAKVATTTVVVNGAAAEASQVVAIEDGTRAYIALYAKTGTCKISLGDGTHADTYMSLGPGNYFETAVNFIGQVEFSTTGAVLHIIQDRDSQCGLTSDNLMLTSDGETMTYSARGSRLLPTPVFS